MKDIYFKFEDISVPAAPYASWRGIARLAMAEEIPDAVIPPSLPEKTPILPVEEEIKPQIEGPVAPEEELAQAVEEAINSLRASGENGKAKLDFEPVNETDAASQIKAKGKIDTAVQAAEAVLRQEKFNAKSPTEKKKQVTRDQSAAIKEEAVREEPKPPVMQNFGSQVVIPPGSPEYEQLRNLPLAEKSQPTPETPKPVEPEPVQKDVGDVRATPGMPEHQEVLEFRAKLQADELAKKNAELEKENAELKARLEEKDKAPETDDTRIMSEDELRELKEKYEREHPAPAGQAEQAAQNVIEQIASDEKSHLELKLVSDGHNIARYWHSIWAKHDKDTLVKREAWVEKLENDIATFADRSWFHTALAPIHPKRILLAYCRAGREYSAQSLIYHEAERKRHEETRAGYIDVAASSLDAARKSAEGRKAEYETYISEMNKYIAGLYEEHKEITMRYGSMPDTPEKRQVFAEQETILKEINDAVAAKSKAQKMANGHGAAADEIQSKQNAYLDMKVLVTQPDTSHKPRRRTKLGAPPKRTTEEKLT